MFSDRSSLVREKKFLPAYSETSRRRHNSSATLTDDHTLFLLYQQRERDSKSERRSWLANLLRRR